MQLDYLIRELTRLRNILPPESEVRIGASGWGRQHTYELNDIRFTPIEEVVEPIHTCDLNCICDTVPWNECPVCGCPGCNDDDVPEDITVYFIEGDQDAYSLPETIDYDELKRRLGE